MAACLASCAQRSSGAKRQHLGERGVHGVQIDRKITLRLTDDRRGLIRHAAELRQIPRDERGGRQTGTFEQAQDPGQEPGVNDQGVLIPRRLEHTIHDRQGLRAAELFVARTGIALDEYQLRTRRQSGP